MKYHLKNTFFCCILPSDSTKLAKKFFHICLVKKCDMCLYKKHHETLFSKLSWPADTKQFFPKKQMTNISSHKSVWLKFPKSLKVIFLSQQTPLHTTQNIFRKCGYHFNQNFSFLIVRLIQMCNNKKSGRQWKENARMSCSREWFTRITTFTQPYYSFNSCPFMKPFLLNSITQSIWIYEAIPLPGMKTNM